MQGKPDKVYRSGPHRQLRPGCSCVPCRRKRAEFERARLKAAARKARKARQNSPHVRAPQVNSQAKLTAAQVRRILATETRGRSQRHDRSHLPTQTDLAAKYGVSTALISRIQRGQRRSNDNPRLNSHPRTEAEWDTWLKARGK